MVFTVFADNGTVYCVYHTKTTDKQYVLYVYNGDNDVDDTTTFRFTCMV